MEIQSTQDLKEEAQQILEEFLAYMNLSKEKKNSDPEWLMKVLLAHGKLITNFHMRLNRLEVTK